MQAIFNWKVVYTFWAISYIIHFCFYAFSPLNIITTVYWGILGIITTIVGCYHVYKKHWMDALLYFCLFLFPQIVIFIIRNIYEEIFD